MPSDAVNLYDIYAKFLNRKNRGSAEPGVRAAADRAAEVAKQLLDAPTHENVRAIKEAEAKWMRLAKGSSISYAKEFALAIGSGNFYVKRRGVSSAWGDYQPEEGYIYGASSIDRPGWLKLGATAESPLDRIEQFRKRHGLREVTLLYYAKVSKPFSVEDEIRKCLKIYNHRESQADSREWFAIDPEHAIQVAIDAIVRLQVTVFIPLQTTKAMASHKYESSAGVDWIRHGGRLAQRDNIDSELAAAERPLVQTIEAKVAQNHTAFAIGDKVRHQQFGLGIVQGVTLEETTVLFPSVAHTSVFQTEKAVSFLQRYEPGHSYEPAHTAPGAKPLPISYGKLQRIPKRKNRK